MRLHLIMPRDLTLEQKALYDEMRSGIAISYKGVPSETEGGALIGPYNPWLHEPEVGKAIWHLNRVLAAMANIPDHAREVAILVVGARFRAAYELYAHLTFASNKGMSQARLATLVSGNRPDGLSEEEGCAYDVAFALCEGGVLPQPCYDQAVRLFGQRGLNELVYLVGFYVLASMTMNAFDVPTPQ
jgi:4-carboxymuconolactone decarboxylase